MSGQAYMSIHGNLCYGGLLRGSAVPAKFSCLTRCMRKRRRSTRWLCYGLVDRAGCVSRDVTLHRLSVLIGPVDNSPLDSRLHFNASHAKECLTHHPCIESVTVGCLCQCCTHKSSFTLSSYFAHNTFTISAVVFFFFKKKKMLSPLRAQSSALHGKMGLGICCATCFFFPKHIFHTVK